MKKILLFVAALMTAMCAMAQEKFYVYMNDGTTKEYAVAECDSLSLVAPPAPAPTTGEAKTKDGTLVKWVQLWENGPKFAEYNVGATSVGEYGGYYCWGMTIDKDPDAAYYKGEEDIQGGEHDTAKNLWGSNWQMATKADFDALIANCDVAWKSETDGYGVAGNLYIGKGDYSGNSVFFPAAGYYDVEVDEAGRFGYYWSTTFYGGISVYDLYFYSGYQLMNYGRRDNGYSVRAILNERK
ncbi:MAG: hypothetical protein MJ010_06305 [Paludibacteraceae bacterium]|nr:hypothetical protein [Paludibacteraceae bacterium]